MGRRCVHSRWASSCLVLASIVYCFAIDGTFWRHRSSNLGFIDLLVCNACSTLTNRIHSQRQQLRHCGSRVGHDDGFNEMKFVPCYVKESKVIVAVMYVG